MLKRLHFPEQEQEPMLTEPLIVPDLVITGADIAVDGGYSALGPEQVEPAISKLME